MGLFRRKRTGSAIADSLKDKAISVAESVRLDAAEARGRAEGRRLERERAIRKGETATAAKVSGLRGVTSGIVGTLLANQVRASTGKAGVAGVAAGLAFNMLLKRNPMGAILFGGAILAHKAYRSGQKAKAQGVSAGTARARSVAAKRARLTDPNPA